MEPPGPRFTLNPYSQRKMPTNEMPATLCALSLLAAAALLAAAPVSGQTGGAEGAVAPGPGAAPAYDECASAAVVFDEGSEPLTRAERIARMEQALHESLSRFERCRTGTGSGGGAAYGQGGGSGAAGGRGQAGGGGRTGESSESGEGNAVAGSVASRSVSGTGVSDADGPGTGSAGENGESAPASGSVASRSVSGTEAAPETDARDEADRPGAAGSETGTQAGSATYAPDAASASAQSAPDAPNNGNVPDDIPAADNDSVLEAQIRRAATAETDPEIRAKLWNEYRAYKGLPQVPADQ